MRKQPVGETGCFASTIGVYVRKSVKGLADDSIRAT